MDEPNQLRIVAGTEHCGWEKEISGKEQRDETRKRETKPIKNYQKRHISEIDKIRDRHDHRPERQTRS